MIFYRIGIMLSTLLTTAIERNREVVMTAIAKDPAALRYALDESLRQDPEIIQALKPPPFSRPSYVSGLII